MKISKEIKENALYAIAEHLIQNQAKFKDQVKIYLFDNIYFF